MQLGGQGAERVPGLRRRADARRDRDGQDPGVLDSRYVASDVRHSFKTKFGETIDCIDFFAQRSVKRLAERGYPITHLPPRPARTVALPDDVFNGQPDENGAPRECPEGAVAVLRTTVADVKAAGGLEAMRRRPRMPPASTCPLSALEPDLLNFAHVIENFPPPSTPLQHVVAGTAVMNVLQPTVPTGTVTGADGGPTQSNDHSLAQVWMTAGCGLEYDGRTCEGTDCINSVEVGWDVDPNYLENGKPQPFAPHLFIFSTTDGYVTGCYNNDPMRGQCDTPGNGSAGWVGAPHPVMTPGMQLTPSTLGGNQTELTIKVSYTTPSWANTPGWLVQVSTTGGGNLTDLGYYPAGDFRNQMQSSGDDFQVGGEIADVSNTMIVPMGSGAPAVAGYGQAGYVYDFAASSTESGWTNGFNVTGVTEPSGARLNYAISTTTPPKPGGNWQNYFYYGSPQYQSKLVISQQALRAIQALSGGHPVTVKAVHVGADGAMYGQSFQNNEWTASTAFTSTSFAPPAAGVAVVATSSTQNALFVVGSDGKLYVASQTSGGPWSALTALTAASFAKPGALLATGTAAGLPVVFVVDVAGKLRGSAWSSTLGWVAPVALTAANYAPSGSPLAVGTRASGEFDVFSVGQDGALKYMFYNLGVWGGPFTLTKSSFAPLGAQIATALDVHGYLNVMTIGNNGALYTDWDVTPLWSGPTALTIAGFAPAGGGLSAINFNNQSLNVFLADNAGTVDQLTNTGLGWQGPNGIAPYATVAGAALSAVLQGTNELDLFTSTPGSASGVLESIDIGGTWSNPVPLP